MKNIALLANLEPKKMSPRKSIAKIAALSLFLLSFAHASAAQNAAPHDGAATSPDIASGSVEPPPVTSSFDGLHKRGWRYKINPNDSLSVTFNLTPEFNQTVTVQPDGYISLRDAGDVQAAGQTLPELTESIKKAYSKFLQDPQISVEAKEFEKPYFTVGGQVGKPGKFDWYSDITLTQAIAIAGGFTDASKHSQVLLFRRVSEHWTEAKIIDVKKMMETHNLSEDPDLKPGDMLFVPKSFFSKIKPFLPTTSTGVFANPAMM
jgi:polysaccharide export outer membrane protein